MKKFVIKTLGCKTNQVESALMAEILINNNYIETNDIMDIIEEMKGDDEERKQHPEDYDSFAEYIIDTFYQIKINLQRDTAERQNLEFKETGKEEIYQDLNPFLRR